MDQPFSVSWNICLHNLLSNTFRPGAFRHDCVARFQSLPWRGNIHWCFLLVGWNLQKLFTSLQYIEWNPSPRKTSALSLAWWWHHLKMRQESDLGSSPVPSSEKNPVPWWSGKSIPTKTKGSLPFKIVRLIHVTESHLQQFLGRPVSKADASHR